MFKRKPKENKVPYTKAMLPSCRREVFFDVVKLHYIELITIGLVLFAFALPMIANVLVTDLYTAQLSGGVAGAGTGDEVAQLLHESAIVQITSSLIAIPLLSLLFVGLAGVVRIIRQYAWGEVVFLFRDFSLGIKQNAKHMALLGAIVGCVLAGNAYLYNMAEVNNNVQMMYIASALGAVSLLFLLPVGTYMMVCIPIYGNTFAQNFVQAYAIYMKEPIKTLLMLLCCFGLWALWLIPNTAVHFALLIVGTIGMPFILLGCFLFSYNQLDKYVNEEKHPELVKKGVYFEKDE